MKIAVVGATGLVGREMIKVLETRNFPLDELIAVASANSVGQKLPFKGQDIEVVSVEEALERKPEIVLFSAGSNTSLELAPRFAAYGARVIDNSSAWRMHKNIPLIVPEVNGAVLDCRPPHHRQPQLLNHSNGDGTQTAAQQRQNQKDRGNHLPSGFRNRKKSNRPNWNLRSADFSTAKKLYPMSTRIRLHSTACRRSMCSWIMATPRRK